MIGLLTVLWFIVSVYETGLRNLSSRNDSWNQVLRVGFQSTIPTNVLFFSFSSLATAKPANRINVNP